jgi:hypothetical protein
MTYHTAKHIEKVQQNPNGKQICSEMSRQSIRFHDSVNLVCVPLGKRSKYGCNAPMQSETKQGAVLHAVILQPLGKRPKYGSNAERNKANGRATWSARGARRVRRWRKGAGCMLCQNTTVRRRMFGMCGFILHWGYTHDISYRKTYTEGSSNSKRQTGT